MTILARVVGETNRAVALAIDGKLLPATAEGFAKGTRGGEAAKLSGEFVLSAEAGFPTGRGGGQGADVFSSFRFCGVKVCLQKVQVIRPAASESSRVSVLLH